MEHLKTYIFGLILGIANVIPGVSGGTMAVILNIYDRIILALSKEKIRENASFLILLGAGTLTGILIFSSGITFLLERYEMATSYCFIGLIVGSIPMVYDKAKGDAILKRNLASFFVAFLFMLGLAIIQMMPQTSQGLFSPEELPYLPLAAWLFLSATVSTVGMILPGISGSFIMLLMGVYFMTLKAISAMDLTILIPVVAGVAVGGFFGVRIIRNLLKEHPQNLYFGILGLMVGSIFIIYPGIQINLQGLASLAGLIFCGGISYWFGRFNHS